MRRSVVEEFGMYEINPTTAAWMEVGLMVGRLAFAYTPQVPLLSLYIKRLACLL